MDFVARFDALMETLDATTRRLFLRAVEVVDRAIDVFSLDRICFSFNGGKDSTVVLHLIRLVLAKRAIATAPEISPQVFDSVYRDMLHQLPVMYFDTPNQFPEVQAFIHNSIVRYGFQCEMQKSSYIDGIQAIISKRSTQAFLMGVRVGDPGTDELEHFSPSTKGWPAFFRVNPILQWRYDMVWFFLRQLDLEYCSLYDQGYTSLGDVHNTVRNPALVHINAQGEIEYWPAYKLVDNSSERCGRASNGSKKC
ncbi:3'-phosphoadenosine 5'-phosphosulfate sulfotransferase [Aphanomyces cochlioides]|nr:3'-phosphoadenosine 5'-phosphosulfate sulfotransferase [Aphanomyces cochlioides]